MINRAIVVGGVLAATFVAATAAADETTVTTTTTTTAPTTAAATSTTTVTSAEPPSTTYEQRDLPSQPVVRERSCGLVNHSCRGPHFTLALEGGASSFNESGPFGFNTGVGSVSSAGPTWGARVGIEVLPWLAFDAHYVGMSNHGNGAATPNGSVSLLTSGATGEVRFTAPIPYVHPYLYGGVGVYSTSVTGGDVAQRSSPLYGSTEMGVPMGVGVDVPITGGISAGAELTYHRFFGEAFANDEAIGGGDLTTASAVVRARL